MEASEEDEVLATALLLFVFRLKMKIERNISKKDEFGLTNGSSSAQEKDIITKFSRS